MLCDSKDPGLALLTRRGSYTVVVLSLSVIHVCRPEDLELLKLSVNVPVAPDQPDWLDTGHVIIAFHRQLGVDHRSDEQVSFVTDTASY